MLSPTIPGLNLGQKLGLSLPQPTIPEAKTSPEARVNEVAAASLDSTSNSSRWTASTRNRSLNATLNSTAHEESEGLKEAEVVKEEEGLEGIEAKLDKFEPMWLNYQTEKFFASALALLEITATQQDKWNIKPNVEVNAKIFALFDRLWEVITIPPLGLEDAMKTVFLLGFASYHKHPLTRLSRIVDELEKWVPKENELPNKVDPVLMMGLILGQLRLSMSNPSKSEFIEIQRIEKLFAPIKTQP